MKKKFLSFILAVALVFTFIPTAALTHAASDDSSISSIYVTAYNYSNGYSSFSLTPNTAVTNYITVTHDVNVITMGVAPAQTNTDIVYTINNYLPFTYAAPITFSLNYGYNVVTLYTTTQTTYHSYYTIVIYRQTEDEGNLPEEDNKSIDYSLYTLPFADLNAPYTWCVEQVRRMSDAGFICGYEDGLFHPENSMTYADTLLILLRAFGYDTSVADGEYYYAKAISIADELGITDVIGDVSPTDPVSREDLFTAAYIVMKANYKYLPGADFDSVCGFYSDSANISENARQAFADLCANNIVKGYTANGYAVLNPKNAITRGEASVFFVNLFDHCGIEF